MTGTAAGPPATPDRRTVIEAVLGLVVKLKAFVATRRAAGSDAGLLAKINGVARWLGWGNYPSASDAEFLRIEMGEALRLLAGSDLAQAVLAVHKALGIGIPGLPVPAGAAPPVDDLAVAWSTWMASLETLQRLLEMRLAMLDGASVIASARVAVPPPVTVPLFVGSRGAAKTSDRDEDAIVARAAEKLFGSPLFKIVSAGLVALLVAAVALAGVGSMVIGSTTADIRKTLLDTGDAARKSIGEIATAAQADASRQTTLVAAAEKAISDSQSVVERSVQDAQQSITKEQTRVTAELNGLKDNAVEDVIRKMQDRLGEDAKPLHVRMEQAADALTGEIDALRTQQLAALSARIGTLSGEVSADEQKRTDLAPALVSLNAVSRRIDQISKQVETAGGYAMSATNAAAAAVAAKEDADAAKEDADAAKGYRAAVFNGLGGLAADVDTQRQVFGATKEKLDTLIKQIASLHPGVCEEPDLGSGPWAAQAQLNCLKQRIAVIEAQMKLPAPAPSPAPAPAAITPGEPLSAAQWLAVQHALADKHLYQGKLDGNPWLEHPERSQTRQAIRDWQHGSKGVAQPSGLLDADQVVELIGTWQQSQGASPADGHLTPAQTAGLNRELASHR